MHYYPYLTKDDKINYVYFPWQFTNQRYYSRLIKFILILYRLFLRIDCFNDES